MLTNRGSFKKTSSRKWTLLSRDLWGDTVTHGEPRHQREALHFAPVPELRCHGHTNPHRHQHGQGSAPWRTTVPGLSAYQLPLGVRTADVGRAATGTMGGSPRDRGGSCVRRSICPQALRMCRLPRHAVGANDIHTGLSSALLETVHTVRVETILVIHSKSLVPGQRPQNVSASNNAAVIAGVSE